MCFHDVAPSRVSRGRVLKGLAALGGLPLLGGMAPAVPGAVALNEEAPATAFLGATVLAGDGLMPIPNATIVMRGTRIVDVGPEASVSVPSGAQRIDVRGRYIMPGLIDSHVHFFQSGGLFTRPDALDLRQVRSYADERAWIDAHLPDTFARYLRGGITSVSDVGGPFWNYDVRARASAAELAPRVAAAGPLISSIDRAVLSLSGDPPIVGITAPEDARELVRREAQRQTDFVKFWWIVSPDHPAHAFVPVAQAGMAESKAHGLRVAVHALELETARLAAETGTDILVHCVFDHDVDDAFVALLKRRQIILCPTLRVLGGYQTTFAGRPELSLYDLRYGNPDTIATLFALADLPPADVPALLRARAHADPAAGRAAAMRNVRRLHEAGVTIAAGTDAGNIGTLHSSSLVAELQTMVDAGLSPHDVLVTATLNGAKHLAREHDLGTIAPGKVADLIVLDENPRDDVRNVAALHLVVKNGRAYSPDDVHRDAPEQIVQRRINAINAHSAPALAEVFAADADVADGSATLRGTAEIERYYAGLFAANPDLHVRLTSRSATGGAFVLREEMIGFADGHSQSADTTVRVSGATIASSRSRPSAVPGS
jgi:imidazolonepropionase-like amidohydrolase